MIQHDAVRWGWARADDAERSYLVRVGDLVDMIANLEQRARADAAVRVSGRLSAAALFLLRKDGDAQRVTEDYRFERTTGRLWIAGADGWYGFPSRQSDEDYVGVSGAREMLRYAWNGGDAAHQLLGTADRLAVFRADAATAFPELDWGADLKLPHEAASRDRKAAQAAALASVAPPAGFVLGRRWTDEIRLAFISAYDALIAAGVGKEAALIELASRGWAGAAPTLQKRITEGNQARERMQEKARIFHVIPGRNRNGTGIC
ncbi:hypothetical protein ABDJ40_23805 [Roseateles sp. 2.12]|uniref:Uncharacterized protein n=2 Tax=Roseateles flavus TaxID=3149041 RepID=A0ABV0GL64_9BURK